MEIFTLVAPFLDETLIQSQKLTPQDLILVIRQWRRYRQQLLVSFTDALFLVLLSFVHFKTAFFSPEEADQGTINNSLTHGLLALVNLAVIRLSFSLEVAVAVPCRYPRAELLEADARDSDHCTQMRSFFACSWASSSTVLFPAIFGEASRSSPSLFLSILTQTPREGVSFCGLLDRAELPCPTCPELRFSNRSCRSALFSGLACVNFSTDGGGGSLNMSKLLWQHLAVCCAVLTNGSELLVNHVISYPLCATVLETP